MNQLQHQITLLIPEKLFYKTLNRQDRRRRRENRHNEDVIVHFIPSPLSSRDTLRDFDARRRIDFGSSLMGGPLDY